MMTELTEEQIRDWLDTKSVVLDRAKEQIRRHVKEFLSDWAVTWDFTHEGIDKVRLKDALRIHKKASRHNVASCDQLLERCCENEDRYRFPVHDLLGVRVLVRSLNDVRALREAIESLHASDEGAYPLGNREDFDLEDINDEPRGSGYRALHIDGSVTVREGDADSTIPFEVQIKTLAQHVFGQHTHDEAYVQDVENPDSRYQMVRGFQHALAEELNGVDLLLAQIEHEASDARIEIESNTVGEELTAVAVSRWVREKTGKHLRPSDVARMYALAERAGIDTVSEFSNKIDPSGDEAAAFEARFRDHHKRVAGPRELLFGVLGESDLPDEQEIATTDELDQALEDEPPANELDQFDPKEDLVVPSEQPVDSIRPDVEAPKD